MIGKKEDNESSLCVMIGKLDVWTTARAAFGSIEAIKATWDATTELFKLAATNALAIAIEDVVFIKELQRL